MNNFCTIQIRNVCVVSLSNSTVGVQDVCFNCHSYKTNICSQMQLSHPSEQCKKKNTSNTNRLLLHGFNPLL